MEFLEFPTETSRVQILLLHLQCVPRKTIIFRMVYLIGFFVWGAGERFLEFVNGCMHVTYFLPMDMMLSFFLVLKSAVELW